jgi:hypothetical protein
MRERSVAELLQQLVKKYFFSTSSYQFNRKAGFQFFREFSLAFSLLKYVTRVQMSFHGFLTLQAEDHYR